jgi:hypothetical protein
VTRCGGLALSASRPHLRGMCAPSLRSRSRAR